MSGNPSRTTVADAPWLSLWVWLCAWLNLAGWVLSALHQLNRTGYVAALLVGGGLWAGWRWHRGGPVLPNVAWRKLGRRFRHPLPLAFLGLSAIALLGGVVHAPANYDALAYRIPRVLHWLAEERWHWIPTEFQRLNVRGCGMEWISAPLLLFGKTDRFLFVINAVGFLLLPGLFFSLLHRLGVRRRVAWHWMWLLPTGYCYLLQAASIGNDLLGANLALVALVFALRARASGQPQDVWLSLLAAAVMTATKASNLPLGLPWLIAIAPAWRVAMVRPVLTALICLVALGSSVVPTAVMNWHHVGQWSGAQAEQLGMGEGRLWNAKRNAVIVAAHHLLPPVFPFAGQFNQHVFGSDSGLAVGELETEEGAGLGLGVTLILMAAAAAAVMARRRSLATNPLVRQRLGWWMFAAGAIGFMVMVGSVWVNSMARLLSPYYALVILPWLFSRGHAAVLRQRWWRMAAGLVFLIAALVVILNPARPLWLPDRVLPALRAGGVSGSIVSRAQAVYRVYGERADVFAPLIAEVPPDSGVLGLVTFDDPEAALWRPFGSRRIIHVRRVDTRESLRTRGARYVLVGEDCVPQALDCSVAELVEKFNARLVRTFAITLRVRRGPENWHLLDLDAREETP